MATGWRCYAPRSGPNGPDPDAFFMPMMYLMYIDESGVTDPTGGTDHFILSGIAIPDEEWKNNDQRLAAIKRRYRLQDSEIHAGWMARKYIEQDRIPSFSMLTPLERQSNVEDERKRFLRLASATHSGKRLREINKVYRKTAPYIHLTRDERVTCLQEIAEEVATWQNARIFGEAINKQASGLDSGTVIENAFTQVITRFQAFLDYRSRHISKELLGLIIQDHNETVCRRLTGLMRKFHKQGTIWREIPRIVETPLFVDSELTSMVQVADLCAYAIRRFFDCNEEFLFNIIYPRVDRSGNKVVGLRHFTGSQPCQCRVCMDHGRGYEAI